jgi:aryl carrier-like protein
MRGYRIELGEIEAVLGEVEGVREVLVQVREDVPGDPRLVAYVVGGAEEGSWEEWRQYLRERLPEYMIPSAFVRLQELPLTANGKVNRPALPAPDKQRPELAAEYLAPVSQLEREIAGVWAEVLQVERVGREDNFFDLGGHSLLMLQVNSRLKELLGREVGMMELFQHPTVSAQAKYLSQTEAAPPSFQDSRARGQKQREVLIRQRELAKARV